VAEQKRQQAADQEGDTREVSEPGLREQVDGARPEVGRHEEGADQVPRSIKRFAPPESAANELAPGADAVPQEADRPHELEGVAALPPLIEHHGGKGKAQHCRAQR
jgi:hypothetical protein